MNIVPMTYDEFVEFIRDMHLKAADLVVVRNKGYSPYTNPFSNFMQQRDILEAYFGERYPLINIHGRACDKHSREETFITQGLPTHKDKYDEFLDAANYSFIQAAWWETLYRNDPKLIEGPIKK